MRRASLLSSALLLVPTLLSAQSASPLVGAWNVDVPAGVRIEDGEPETIFARGTLDVVALGDSLIGTLKVQPPSGMPARPPARLAAKAVPGPATFVNHGEATINANGVETKHASTSTFSLEAKGDSLHGTVTRIIEGVESPLSQPQRVTGVRAKPAG
jgi:hypothetical protein